MKLKIKQTILIMMTLVGIVGAVYAPAVNAAECGGVKTSIISCDEKESKNLKESGLWGLLMLGINILTVGVGVAAVAGIIWGATLFLTASDNAEQVRKGRMVIWNTVIGIILYAAMVSFLNFIIPGGLFY